MRHVADYLYSAFLVFNHTSNHGCTIHFTGIAVFHILLFLLQQPRPSFSNVLMQKYLNEVLWKHIVNAGDDGILKISKFTAYYGQRSQNLRTILE